MTRCTECITLRLDQSSSCIAFPPTCNNYATARNFFPDVLKENTVVPAYKKANMTDPNNHRGIVLANTLQIIASSWLLHKFQSYVGDMGFIPTSQRSGATRSTDQRHDAPATLDWLRQNSDCYVIPPHSILTRLVKQEQELPLRMESIVYFDRLDSVRVATSMQKNSPARHALRLLQDTKHLGNIIFAHVRAHTANTTDAVSRMNEKADAAAKEARSSSTTIAIPMKHIDEYALFSYDQDILHQ